MSLIRCVGKTLNLKYKHEAKNGKLKKLTQPTQDREERRVTSSTDVSPFPRIFREAHPLGFPKTFIEHACLF